jgi:6-pyruvoyltetrahydropterin/6-carboxytetrahydropterin synthase
VRRPCIPICVSRTFSAAHYIKGAGGRCENTHGHNYRVEVCVSAARLKKPGMVADFTEVGRKLDSILPDHTMLNEHFDFNPTAENIARYLFDEMTRLYPVSRVRVWENDRSWAEYSAD